MRVLDRRGAGKPRLTPADVLQRLLGLTMLGRPVAKRPGALVELLSPEERQVLQGLTAADCQPRLR